MKRIILPILLLTTSFTILAQQKVGIGTNAAAEKLEVAGNIKPNKVKPYELKKTLSLVILY